MPRENPRNERKETAARGRVAQSGQILFPALLILPSLFLFVMLIYETSRLSTAKMRQQFAMDSAAFLEMNQYTDVLNRTAYLDGAFPHRIAMETGLVRTTLMQYTTQPPPYDDQPVWNVEYHNAQLASLNVPNPPLEIADAEFNQPGSRVVIPRGALAAIVDSYQGIYTTMETLAQDQWQVFQVGTLQQHALARKSLWLNTGSGAGLAGCNPGSPAGCGNETASGFPNLTIRYHYLDLLIAYAEEVHMGVCVEFYPVNFDFGGRKLFQIATIPPDQVDYLGDPGLTIQQHWSPPSNQFGIDLQAQAAPYVRAHVVSTGGQVWPDPTPRFHTELQP